MKPLKVAEDGRIGTSLRASRHLCLPLLLALAHSSCSSTSPSDPPERPRRFVVGVVKGVYDKDFVIFKRTAAWMPASGQPLEWRPRDGKGKGGTLVRSPQRRGTLFVADIRSGSPAVGDLIYFHEIPGVPDAATETIGTVPETAAQPETLLHSPAIHPTDLSLPADLPPLRPPPEERTSPPATRPLDAGTPRQDEPDGRAVAAPATNPSPPSVDQLPPLRPPPD